MKYFESMKVALLTSINTAMPCKVLSYNEGNRTAKIQPLFKAKEVGKEPRNLPPIEGVPVLFQKYKVDGGSVQTFTPALSIGDIVLVVFCQRSIDDAGQGKNVYPGISRMFSIQDAIIVGVI